MVFLSPAITVYICFLAALIGACMGSFLNCMAWRIVHGESIIKGRSHCDYCGHVLGAKDLIPIVSFAIHKGRCPYCKARLSAGHVIAEAISAMVFVSIVLRYDISLKCLEYLLLACILLVCSFADLEGYLIPDRFIIAGALVRVVFILISKDRLSQIIDSAIGGLAIPVVLLIIVLVFEKIRGREAMGGGDLKLLFVTGLYLGWAGNLMCLLFACIIGIVFAFALPSGRKTPIDEKEQMPEQPDEERSERDEKEKNEKGYQKAFPWGPSIAISAFIVLMAGKYLINWYLGLF